MQLCLYFLFLSMCFIWTDEGLTNTSQLILQRQNLVLRMFLSTELSAFNSDVAFI